MIFPPTSQEMQDPCYGFVAQAVERRRAEQEGKKKVERAHQRMENVERSLKEFEAAERGFYRRERERFQAVLLGNDKLALLVTESLSTSTNIILEN
jgi:hypothetical protein